MRDGTITRGQFIEAVRTVLLGEGVSLDSLKGKAPYGFWSKIGTLTGQEATGAQVYWGRVKKKGLSLDEEAWLRNVDMVDQAQEAVEQETPESVKVARVDHVEGPPSTVTDDKVDQLPTVDNVDTSPEPISANDDNLDEEAEIDEPAVKYDKVDKRELESMLQALELRLTTLIDQRIDEAMATAGTPKDVSLDNIDMPPVPPKVGEAGKKFAGSKSDIRARIDSKLFELLEREAREHFSGNMSRCLDALLWRYYAKPRLSFESDTDE